MCLHVPCWTAEQGDAALVGSEKDWYQHISTNNPEVWHKLVPNVGMNRTKRLLRRNNVDSFWQGFRLAGTLAVQKPPCKWSSSSESSGASAQGNHVNRYSYEYSKFWIKILVQYNRWLAECLNPHSYFHGQCISSGTINQWYSMYWDTSSPNTTLFGGK